MDPQASAASREIQETSVASCGAEMSFGSAGTGEINFLTKMVVGGERTRDYPNMEKTQLFTVRQREVFADLLASAKSRKEYEYSSLQTETESEFIQKLASECGATKIAERIKTANQAEADARKALEASQSELRNAEEALEASGFSVDSCGVLSLNTDAPRSVRQARDKYLGKLEKENQDKLHEYDVATLNVWAAETADEAKKCVEELV